MHKLTKVINELIFFFNFNRTPIITLDKVLYQIKIFKKNVFTKFACLIEIIAQ